MPLSFFVRWEKLYPVSDNYIKTVLSPRQKEVFVKIEFYDSTMRYLGEYTKQVSKNDIGSISVSMDRPIRRSFSFSLDNTNGDFTWGEQNLIWIDKRVKVYTGLKLLDGTIEYVPQGVFIMTEPQDSHDFNGKRTSINGMDKAYLYTDKRGKFVNETTIANNTLITEAIKTIAQGETLFNFDNIATRTPRELTYAPSDNRWQAIEELAKFAECDVYYDVDGYLRLRKIDLNEFDAQPVVWSYKYGDPTERFYAGNIRKMDDSGLANHIRVIGGSSQTPSVLYDLVVDENNPLWVDNPYSIQKIGKVTYFHNNGNPDFLIDTTEKAKWRAKYELMKRLGYAERISLSISPMYLHDAGDVIEIIDAENSVQGKYLMESFQVPLNPQLMMCECIKYRKVIDDWNFI